MISRLGRKRRERRAQTQPDHPFAVEQCEYLTDGAFALLRVSGTGSVAPVALITQGDGPESFDPLPQPGTGANGGEWHIAFALPTDVIEPGARVWLHDGGLYLADVLIPAPGVRDSVEPAPAQPEPVEHEPAEQEDPGDDERAKKLIEAWAEAAQLRDRLADREDELAKALKELLAARTALEAGEPARDDEEIAKLRAEIARLERELVAARAETAAAEQQRAELEESNRSRRAGIARRKEDRDARRQVAELEAKLAEREQRIGELEAEAKRVEKVGALEDEARRRAATNDDLRALLESEREISAAARREVDDLKQQLATVSAEYAAKAAEPAVPAPRPATKVTAAPSGAQSPPWSALDDELLARIEKAKAATS